MSGKKYSDAVNRYDKQMLHDPIRAVEIVKEMASAKFDEAIDIAVGLGVDPRKADQMVRGTIALPSGTGGDVRVAVFAQGDAAAEAAEAGADVVGAEDLAERIESGFTDFDLAIATQTFIGDFHCITTRQNIILIITKAGNGKILVFV